MGDAVTGIEIKVDNIYKAKEVAMVIQGNLGFPYWTKDWMEMNKNLFSALRLEKLIMFIILFLIVFVAAFNIVSTLIMVVMEKNKDIAIMKSMGAPAREDLCHRGTHHRCRGNHSGGDRGPVGRRQYGEDCWVRGEDPGL
jgi:ABC-type lipoprotein release transport system permease subunit